MQVKKFEAKTMKEALDLVKVHLGPEAIILSAKDTHLGFGLMGEKSVEVTAAVSEETLRKKKIYEAKLREDLRERFQQIPASKQKEFINKVFQEREDKRELVTAGGTIRATAKATPESRAQAAGMRYVDIPEDEAPTPRSVPERFRQAAPSPRNARVSRAATAAAQAAQALAQKPTTNVSVSQGPPIQRPEMNALESQVRELKALVERFQKMPQIPLTMHPGADQGLPFELSPAYQRLTQQGLPIPLVSTILKKAQKEMDFESLKKPALIEAWLVGQLLGSVEVCPAPSDGRYHIFMGSTGQGKTTSLVKFASRLVMKEKKTIAVISLDTIKVGAADQLRIYAQILNVPFATVRTPEEWRVAEQKLGNVQHILVDCPGFNLQSMAEADWLKRMLPPPEFKRTIHYVQSVLARDEEALDLAGRYQMLGFHDVIFTRLDESSRQGLLLGFQQKFRVPFHSFGMGARIPEDYEYATKERVIDFLFKLSTVTKREEST